MKSVFEIFIFKHEEHEGHEERLSQIFLSSDYADSILERTKALPN